VCGFQCLILILILLLVQLAEEGQCAQVSQLAPMLVFNRCVPAVVWFGRRPPPSLQNTRSIFAAVQRLSPQHEMGDGELRSAVVLVDCDAEFAPAFGVPPLYIPPSSSHGADALLLAHTQ
jgi:hypothetical protein